MERYICIHGHFYQPPRENAWLEFVELQDSAYPFHDWNERITAECYAPNGRSRILDGSKNVDRIVNNYAYISYNFGPTLLSWMKDTEPDVYQWIIEADRESQQRYSGHGSAMAQSYNHTILPLSNGRDKYTQLYWGIRDFKLRFGRDPEGLWLPETAVDLEVLEILVDLGIRFTVLSPYQAKRTKALRARNWKDVNGGMVDPSAPYIVRLPSGRRINVFFYDGPISQAIAFEKLLERGEDFASRLLSAFSDHDRPWPQIVNIATDGETYGHHHKHGDMALAYALHHIETNNLAKLTNYGEYLAKHPPRMEAEIWEGSAWSCAHGVERWNSNCGCNSGGHGDWNQEWRGPLRRAFDWLRDAITPRYEQKGAEYFRDVWAARNEYIDVILDREPANRDRFFDSQALRELNAGERITAFKLLEMQRHAMLMYTSCGWFFDELSGIETTQVIQYAARALQLYEEVFGESIEEQFLQQLEQAKSNIPEHENGRVIYNKFVKPAMVDRKSVAAHYALSSLFQHYEKLERVYCYSVDREDFQERRAGHAHLASARLRIISEITTESEVFTTGAVHLGDHMMNAGVQPFESDERYQEVSRDLLDWFERADIPDVIRTLDRHFGDSTYSLRSIFKDDQRRIMNVILKSTVTEAEELYRRLYETHAAMMRFMADLRMPLPPAYQVAANFALNSTLRAILENPDALDPNRVRALLDEARANGLKLDGATLSFALEETLATVSKQLLENPADSSPLRKFETASSIARNMPFEVNIWRAQNNYHELMRRVFAERLQGAESGDAEAKEWVEHFLALGKNLAIKVDSSLAVDHAA